MKGLFRVLQQQESDTMRFGRKRGINVDVLTALARIEGCRGIQFSEFSSSESYCSKRRCVNALLRAVLNGSMFADIDSIQLASADVSLYRYSLPVDVPRLVLLEGRPGDRNVAIDLRFYAVYNIDAALLLIFLLLFRSLLTVVKSRKTIKSYGSVIEDLLNGTRRLLIDTGVLMENEQSAFGPLTTVITDERERMERLCNDEDDVAILWDDQLFGLTSLNQTLMRHCIMNRIDIPVDTNNHPIPRLAKSLTDGEYLYFAMPRSTPRKTVERLNHLLTSIYTHDLRNSLHVRRHIPARSHGAAFDAYRSTFPSGVTLPAFLSKDSSHETNWHATSLIHLLYPLIAFCIGLGASFLVFCVEIIVNHQKGRWKSFITRHFLFES